MLKVIALVIPLLSKNKPSKTELYGVPVVDVNIPTLLITFASIARLPKLASKSYFYLVGILGEFLFDESLSHY